MKHFYPSETIRARARANTNTKEGNKGNINIIFAFTGIYVNFLRCERATSYQSTVDDLMQGISTSVRIVYLDKTCKT